MSETRQASKIPPLVMAVNYELVHTLYHKNSTTSKAVKSGAPLLIIQNCTLYKKVLSHQALMLFNSKVSSEKVN